MEQGADCWRKGPWTPQEDKLLLQYVTEYGEGRWSSVSKCTGLKRSGKSSRLRWVNYLRPGLKKGHLTPQEEGIIIELHSLWGNRWSTIARYLPGRTDNEIKNYWRTHFKPRKASHAKQEKSKILNHEFDISEFSPQESDMTNCSKKEEEIEFVPIIENHQYLPAVNQETASDFIPQDCYLWGGLWNMDDDDQNQLANIANCYHPFEGDGFDFMQSGEFLL